jgi:hypothetical protein
MRKGLGLAVLAASVALGGCAYNGLGMGVGYGSGYGYGYGSPYGGYGYNPYDAYYRGYSPYGYSGIGYGYGYGGYGGYGSPYGWYDGWYYPGSGYYIYDRDRQRRRISDAERTAWRQRIGSGLAERIRQRRGETSTPTTTTNSVVRQRAVEAPRTSTRSVSRESRRESVRESLRSRIESRRAERQSTRSRDKAD